MKMKFKTLSNTHFEIEVDPTLTIKELKASIETARPDIGLASALKLIYKGRILDDGCLVDSYGFQDADFVVVMVTKAKAAPKATAALPPVAAVAPAAPEAAPAPAVAPAPAPTESRQGDEQVELLCAMGFAREDVARCLRAAFGNADRAVEYLTNGIPPNAGPAGDAQTDQMAPAAFPAVDGGGMHPAPFPAIPQRANSSPDPERQAEVAAAMEELQRLPNFQEIVGTLQENPASLRQMLPVLAQERPELFDVINANREVFAELLAGGQSSWGVGRRLRGREGGGFRLNPEELEAVSRLQQLGFPRAAVIEAFVACDKNEEITANYLFDNGIDLGGD
mmetsp:Transcript_44057/g.79248  ORF Transcript_44057/g.79248 Transcript_44057/m.79248 type:complete len:337 (+) Transcript_44057:99-1109(+)